ncbi:MAG: haloacid dehalogenase-like hydrolase [Candidatus Rokubacteria bacterium]|nr:haloacid dehalogenase-like hydrolase [Candidatus Rokubacteria bacterium]
MRLVLFDVDGTLLSASGAGRRALGRALVDVFGTAGPIDSYDFHGGTDPQIVRDLLGAAGLPLAEILAREAELFACYLEQLEAELGDGRGVRLYPGVAALVEALAGEPDCVVGLLTGNIEPGARLKLRSTGLWPRFRLGAYGSDDADRTRLPAVAAQRAGVLVGRTFRGRDVVVIGDTPRDVGCGRAFGAVCLAVATGRHPVADLEACTPDHVFPDLSDLDRVMAAIFVARPGD